MAALALLLLVSAQAAAPAAADPARVYERAAASVVVVLALDGEGRVLRQGSGVAIAPGSVITCGHVVYGASRLRVQHAGKALAAALARLDRERDLAALAVPSLRAPAATTRPAAALQVGERVYAIGAPQGLDLSLSEGLVSRLKPEPDGPLVQTTAALSAGSSGGGLFDAEGRLVGITSFTLRQGQNLNFAVPSEWVALALEDPRTAVAPKAPPRRKVLAVRAEERETSTRIVVEADGPLGYAYASARPDAAHVDLLGAEADALPPEIAVGTREVEAVRLTALPGSEGVRLEVRLRRPVRHRVYPEGHRLVLRFDTPPPETPPTAAPAPPAPEPSPGEPVATEPTPPETTAVEPTPEATAFEAPPLEPTVPAPPPEPPVTGAAGPDGPAATRVLDVRLQEEADAFLVLVACDGRPGFETLVLREPDRLVFDLEGVVYAAPPVSLAVERGDVLRVRLAQHAQRPRAVVRLVVDLAGPTKWDAAAGPDGLAIRIPLARR